MISVLQGYKIFTFGKMFASEDSEYPSPRPSPSRGTHHYPHSITGYKGCLVASADFDIVIFHIAVRSSNR